MTMKRLWRLLAMAIALTLIAAACGSGSDDEEGSESTESGETETDDSSDDGADADAEDDEAAPSGPTEAGIVTLADSELAGMNWDEIVAAADGGTVNWFMWGGSDVINDYVSNTVADGLMEEFNITINRVGINDTVDAVNQVLSETEAGELTNGSVDMIWINGENFRTMKQGGLLFCEYWDVLPSVGNLDRADPTLLFDFGTEINDCEVPWSRAQVAMIYNSETVADPPQDIDAILAYACDNPGSFTYPAPPDFTGSVFVRHVFYNEADKLFPDDGGYEVLLGDFDKAVYDQVAEATWATLNEVESCLWRGGDTYPTDKPALDQLFANSEIALNVTYQPPSVGVSVDDGLFPESTRSYGLTSGTISNVNFTAIPFNSPNKAAALVLSNYLLSPEVQLEKADPEVWGPPTVLDVTKLSSEVQAGFDAIPGHPSVIPFAELVPFALPELQGDWVTEIEADWLSQVAEQ